jgi:DNA polymerase-3 subunit beta
MHTNKNNNIIERRNNMKFSIKQRILLEHLNNVIRGISTKNLIPILNCIKFELTNEGLYLISTDNELAIKDFIPSSDIENIEVQGEILISGRYIYDIVRKLTNDIINIEEVIDSQVLITTETSSFKLNCNNVSEFPDIDLDFTDSPIFMDEKVFKTTINQTIFATSTQESRPVLTGINFKINENIMEVTATDSYRLSKKRIVLDNNVTDNVDIIIPSKNLSEIIRLIPDDEDKLEIHVFANKVIFKIKNLIVMTRLINGNYPDTNKLIPERFELKVKVNLNNFFNAIDRASLLTNAEEKNIIKLETKKDVMIISSNIPEIGNVEEKINIERNDDRSIRISFSSKYMMDAIKTFDSEEIELSFNGEIKPIIINYVDNDDLTQLILPIRTY